MSKDSKREVNYTVEYFQVANEIFDVEGLDTYEKLVYMYLARCGNQGSKAFPSYNTIAEKCDMGRSKAIKSVKTLEEIGLLTKEEREFNETQNKTNLYEVEKPRDVRSLPNKKRKSSTNTTPPSVSDTPPSVQDTLNDKEIKDKETQKETYVQPRNCSVATDIFLNIFRRQNGIKHSALSKQTFLKVEAKLDNFYDKHGEEDFREMLSKYFDDFKRRDNDGLPKLQHFLKVSDRFTKYY